MAVGQLNISDDSDSDNSVLEMNNALNYSSKLLSDETINMNEIYETVISFNDNISIGKPEASQEKCKLCGKNCKNNKGFKYSHF